MAFRVRPVPYNPVVEEYAPDFADIQHDMDMHSWRGDASVMEFPHNEGSLEEKIDEEQKRKIAKGKGYRY